MGLLTHERRCGAADTWRSFMTDPSTGSERKQAVGSADLASSEASWCSLGFDMPRPPPYPTTMPPAAATYRFT